MCCLLLLFFSNNVRCFHGLSPVLQHIVLMLKKGDGNLCILMC